VLTAIAGPDPRDPATAASAGRAADYTAVLNPDALRGARIGVSREGFFGISEKADRVIEEALQVLRDCGAELIDPATLPSMDAIREMQSEIEVLLYEARADLDAYLGALGPDSPVHSLEDVIAFNEAHAAEEMPYFGQEMFLRAREKGSLDEEAYREALATCRRLGGAEGIDAAMAEHRLDALIAPTGAPTFKIDLIDGDHHLGGSSRPAAIAGYPAVTVPAGYIFNLPVGITFMGSAWSEARLLALAHSFELAAQTRRLPQYLPES
jgi:amidase